MYSAQGADVGQPPPGAQDDGAVDGLAQQGVRTADVVAAGPGKGARPGALPAGVDRPARRPGGSDPGRRDRGRLETQPGAPNRLGGIGDDLVGGAAAAFQTEIEVLEAQW